MKLPLSAMLAATGFLAAGFLLRNAVAGTPMAPPDPARVPVLLELFTSEGCSSCPPADRLLEALDRQPVASAELIVLSEHVDYWNDLGWTDPYSSPVFSDRQWRYSGRLGSSVYTPQLVVDGQFQVLGSDRQDAVRAIAQTAQRAKFTMSVRASGSGMVHVEANSGGTKADLYLAVAADRARSQVLRGENGGQTLTHVAVAQSVTRIGKWEGSGATGRGIPIPRQAVHGPTAAGPGETRVIAILQDPLTGRILGAAQTRM